ncbi:MAG: FtsX-like permease family protein [Anaerolineae bacterium]|nr:FtsX-like permease family protein [Anaerolineae bacterium]
MSALLRLWAIFVVAAKRLFSQRGLALATTLGLITAVALTMSVPLYADAVYYRILRKELSGKTPGEGGNVTRPPFAFMFRYLGAWHGPLQWEDIQKADQYLSGPAAKELGLPLKMMVRHFKTNNFRLFPEEDIAYADTKQPLAWVSFGFISDLQDHIKVIEGNFPKVAEPTQDSTVEVLVSEHRAMELGLQVGETYIAFDRRATKKGRSIQIPVRIAGVWEPRDPKDEYWFYNPAAMKDLLLVPESTFVGRLSPYLDDEVYLALWYLVMDGSNVHSSDVGRLLVNITAVRQKVSSLLPDTSLDISPVDELERYRRSAALLTILLYAFSVPIIGLILAFVGLVVGLAVGRQRGEIAMLRSRGATMMQVVGIAALEASLLGALALVAGSPVGEVIAHIIGRARSFLNFTAQSNLRVGVTAASLRFGVIAIGLALVAQIVPTIGAARHTIVTYKQERARQLRPPWWQRAWLDILLLIPAAYGAYLLRQQGSIALPTGGVVGNDPFQNPLLFLVPALGIFALTLLFLRFLPAVMAGIGWIASHTGSVGVLLASRQLSRTPGFYTAPLILLILTLSLSAFTASLAQTLDNHLYDQMYYKVGADMNLAELGESSETSGGGGFGAIGGGPSGEESNANTGGTGSSTTEEEGPRWFFLPVTEHLKVPGIEAATRVGRYKASTELSGKTQTGVFIGVDRVDFPKVAFWRWDFAPATLGALMNALAVAPDGVLVPRDLMIEHALNVGDTIRVTVDTYGQRRAIDMKIVGYFDMFPTWYPDDGPLFVGNLDYLFEQVGGQFPYDVWVKTAPNVDYEKIVAGVRDLNLRVLDWDAALLDVAKEQERPERQGLFGLLSVGFGAAALLTVLGFLLYALFSFRRRFIELGILRAIGLSSAQMTVFLAWELAFLILTGLVAGTLLGAWMSELFIPYLQVGTGPSARIPPFLVEIAWPAILRIYALFGLLFLVALGVLAVLLLRMKIFQAIKLGETT